MRPLRQLLRSPTVASVVVHGLAGGGFAGANILLARLLPQHEYALFTLVLALMNMGHAFAPVGIDGVVIRRNLEATPRLLLRVLATTSGIGLLVAVVGVVGYELPGLAALLVFVATAGGGAMYVAAARFQREQRFAPSLTLSQSPNLFLIAAALATLAVQGTTSKLPLLIATIGYAAPALWGWAVLLRERHTSPGGGSGFAWREALAIMGLNGAGVLLVQLDRLVIPHVLPLAELAPYGVLAAIVGSLFRVLQMGVAFSLIPRLAAATDVPARRRLIAGEARLVALIVVAGSITIWVITPPVEQVLLAGKYHLSAGLILSAIAAGVAKTLNAFSNATVTALADQRELTLVNLWGWLSILIAIAAAVALAPWGLAGVVYGVGLGWLVRAVSGLVITLRHLRVAVPHPSIDAAL